MTEDIDADHLEASAIRYNTQRIVRLSSGAFALFSDWDQASGIAVLRIGSLDDLRPLIASASELTEHFSEGATFDDARPSNLREVLAALIPPSTPINRRI